MEHYSDLDSRENIVSPASLDVIECLPTMDELESEPLVEELSKASDSLASGKAPGNDGMLPDLSKHGKTTLLFPLHESFASSGKKELWTTYAGQERRLNTFHQT